LRVPLADVMIEPGDLVPSLAPSRLPSSLAASAALHLLAVVVVMRVAGTLAVPNELPRGALIPVSLVSLPGGGGGVQGDGTPAPTAAPVPRVAPPAPAATPKPVVKKPVARPTPVTKPRSPAATPAVAALPDGTSGAAAGRGSGDASARGTGNGDGTGGDGSGGARPAYGANPRPPYPLAARRLHIEGRVLLEVVVRPDGRAASVRVAQSSGHDLLDASAADTVRTRWRFVPARRDGVAVESRVTVPIRFRIDEG
jgi:protein TonB